MPTYHKYIFISVLEFVIFLFTLLQIFMLSNLPVSSGSFALLKKVCPLQNYTKAILSFLNTSSYGFVVTCRAVCLLANTKTYQLL